MRSLSSSSVAARFWCGWRGMRSGARSAPKMPCRGWLPAEVWGRASWPTRSIRRWRCFYFLVVPRFVPAGAPLFRSVMILTMVHVGLAFTWHASCAAAAGAFSRFLSSRTARRGIDLVTGLVLIAFAINMLLSPKWRGREPATGQPFHTNAISSTATPPRFGLSVVVSSGSVAALYSASSAATSAASSVSSRASLSFSSCTVPVARATS